ncbi:TPA: hypothetical protein DCW61_04800 [Candidatus Uhrbacteria bacterium]|nr:hypothetical protein [Candidatus Uhrbacteria bacterium]
MKFIQHGLVWVGHNVLEISAKLAILRLTGTQASLQRPFWDVFSDCQPVHRNLIEFCKDLFNKKIALIVI